MKITPLLPEHMERLRNAAPLLSLHGHQDEANAVRAAIELLAHSAEPDPINPYGSGPEPIGPREDVA